MPPTQPNSPPQAPPQPGGAYVSTPPEQLVALIANDVGPILVQMGAPQDAVATVIADFLSHIVQAAEMQGADPIPQLQYLVQLPPEQLAQFIAEFAASRNGGGAAGPPPNGPPQGMPDAAVPGPMPPGGMAPVGAVPPVAVGAPGPNGSPPAMQAPQQAQQQEVKPKKERKPRRPKVKEWEPPDIGKATPKPDYKRVCYDAKEARDYYHDAMIAIQEWRDIYHGIRRNAKLDGTEVNEYNGDDMVTRAQPTIMGDRHIGMTSPDLNRLGLQADPWDDTDEGREAAQTKENFDRYALEEIHRAWNRRATWGDIQPPLDRKVGGLATIEGGYGWRIMPDMEADPERSFPWSVEPVSMVELMPRPRATTRQIECSLGEAWTYPEIRDLLPELTDDDKDPVYSAQSSVRLVTWTDEHWWCLALEFGDLGIQKRAKERTGQADFFVYPPKEHKLGRRIFVLENPWNTTPLGPSPFDGMSRGRFLYRGIYSPIAKRIQFINQLEQAVKAGVFKDILRPLKVKLDPVMRGQNPDLFPSDTQDIVDQANQAGGVVVLGPNEDIEPIVDALAASPNAQFLLQSAMSDLGDSAPPVLGGRGIAESGFDRFQQSDAAGSLNVDPMIQYHCRQWQLMLETIHTDFVRLTDGEKPTWKGLPYKVTRSSTKGGSFRTMLTAKEIKRAGPFIDITYKRLGMTERMQLADLNMRLVKEHLKSRLSAMDELGIDDTERENARMFAEAALESPAVIKAAIRTSLLKQAAEDDEGEGGSLNFSRIFLNAFEEFEAQEAAKAEAEKGMPSPPGAPPMPGQPAAGLPPPMQGA